MELTDIEILPDRRRRVPVVDSIDMGVKHPLDVRVFPGNEEKNQALR